MLKKKFDYLFEQKKILILLLFILAIYALFITVLFLKEENKPESKTALFKEKENNIKKSLPEPPTLKISSNTLSIAGKIYFTKKHESNSVTKYVLDLSNQYSKPLSSTTNLGSHQLISNDGTKIAYYDSDFGLAIKDIKTNKSTLILENKRYFNEPTNDERYIPFAWSPDDKKLLVSIGHWESSSLGVLNIESRIFKEFTNIDGSGSGCIGGKWMKDSQRVLLYGYNYGHPCNIMPGLYLVSILDMKTIPLFGTSLDAKTFSVDEPVERNNNEVLFHATQDFKPSSGDGVYDINLDTKQVNKLTVDYLGKVWKNNNSFYYSTDGEIILYDLTTKSKKVIVSNKDKTLSLIPVTMSPDGKYLAYVIRVIKYNKSGVAIYSNTIEDNLLRAVDTSSGQIYDLTEDVEINSPILWLSD